MKRAHTQKLTHGGLYNCNVRVFKKKIVHRTHRNPLQTTNRLYCVKGNTFVASAAKVNRLQMSENEDVVRCNNNGVTWLPKWKFVRSASTLNRYTFYLILFSFLILKYSERFFLLFRTQWIFIICCFLHTIFFFFFSRQFSALCGVWKWCFYILLLLVSVVGL